jgi:hypothetical protein
MDSRKYEKLMNYVINEEIEKARELFHQIVVEKSREIYESIMSEEEEEEMGGKVGDLLDEINAEESGMMEDDDDDDFDTETDDDLDDSDMDYEFGGIDDDESESLDDTDEQEETLIRIEDKLDELIAEFDRITKEKDDDEEDMDLDDEEDMDLDDEEDMDLDDEEDMDLDDEEDEEDEDTDEVMEAVQLQKVSVTPGDNGSNKRSPVPADSGKRGMNSSAVKFAGDSEPVPNGPKSPNNFYTKGQKEVPGAGQFKNAPGHKKASLTAVPKPKHSDSGVNSKSPIAESRKARVVRAKK